MLMWYPGLDPGAVKEKKINRFKKHLVKNSEIFRLIIIYQYWFTNYKKHFKLK